MIHTSDILRAKLLIVDDQAANVLLLERLLRSAGYSAISTTQNPQEVVDLHRQNRYDLILLDLNMPEMDGYEAMRRIREQERFKKLPMLALTAKAMRDDRAKCLEAGANDYITKPVDTEKLQSLMRVWLRRS